MPHLLVAISPHGYGHMAQVVPVINRLQAILPDLQLTFRTTLPAALLQQRVHGEYAIQCVADDFGMLQHNALEVDLPGSLECYRKLHDDWSDQVEQVAQELEAVKPDLIFADVPYLTLAAAKQAGIPSVAMCCLNWHTILQGYVKAEDGLEVILRQMQQAYAAAEVFLRPAPYMPMPELDNLRDIGVVARQGRNRREELLRCGYTKHAEQLILVAMGGIDLRLPVEQWPKRTGVRYVVPAVWKVRREDCMDIESFDMSFSDLLASSDLIITKPGYGTFTEAALNDVPVLYVSRGDWPEEACLVEWLQQNARCREVSRDALEAGEFGSDVETLLATPVTLPLQATGVEEAAVVLASYLSECSV